MNPLTQNAGPSTAQATAQATTQATAQAAAQTMAAAPHTATSEAALRPPVDVLEDATGITLYADLPGVKKEDLQVNVEGDQLAIEAAVALNVPQGMQAAHAEVALARYRRAFTLSKELDATRVTAELAHGVLRLRIPKAAHAQPRRIQVNVG